MASRGAAASSTASTAAKSTASSRSVRRRSGLRSGIRLRVSLPSPAARERRDRLIRSGASTCSFSLAKRLGSPPILRITKLALSSACMTAEMAFGLLGPLSVSRQGRTIHVTAGRQRAVLAALLLSPGRVLGWDDLAEVLWGANPPSSARVAVQNYVMRLRRLLGDGGTRLATWPGGYAIDVAPGELDLYRAEELMASAREATAAGAWDVAADRAGQALALWRGQPLADVPSETLSLREVPRLAEFRLRALELRIDADLHLGDHVQAIGELRQLTRAHPLRERLHELLVLALYREGRRAEALDAYQEARRILVEELGVEPRDELRELQRQVLASERTPAGTVAATARHNGSSVPRQLPAGVPRFTCREPELADLH